VGGARLGEKRRSVGVVGPRSRGESLAGAVLGIAVADEHRDGEFVESVADLAALANASSISWSERRESTVELVARRRKRSSAFGCRRIDRFMIGRDALVDRRHAPQPRKHRDRSEEVRTEPEATGETR